MNIVDPILFQCAVQPKAAALCAPGRGIGLISYGRLANMIHSVSRNLIKLDIRPKKVVVVALEDPIFQTVIVLALMRLGVISVSRYDEQIVDTLKVDALITDKYPPSSKIDQVILADLSWTEGDSSPLLPHELPRTERDGLCRIDLTFGTTGTPKAVAVSHRLLAERLSRHIVVFGNRFPSSTRIFSELSVATSIGFQFLIYTLWRGGIFFFAGNSFESTVGAFVEYGVQCWLTSPGGLEVLLKKYEQSPSLQSETGLVIATGGLLSKSLSDRVRARICSHVVSAYGSTEASVTATSPAQIIEHTEGAVGFVNPGTSVEIVSDEGVPLPAESKGLVRVKSAFAVDHYLGDPLTSAMAFRDGWFYPGDIGILDSQNLLRIVGRHDAVLNLGGDKINPETIERVLAACYGVTECAVFAVANELGNNELFAAVVASENTDKAQLRAHCQANLSQQFVPADFVRVNALPRIATGKIDRQKLPLLLKRNPS